MTPSMADIVKAGVRRSTGCAVSVSSVTTHPARLAGGVLRHLGSEQHQNPPIWSSNNRMYLWWWVHSYVSRKEGGGGGGGVDRESAHTRTCSRSRARAVHRRALTNARVHTCCTRARGCTHRHAHALTRPHAYARTCTRAHTRAATTTTTRPHPLKNYAKI